MQYLMRQFSIRTRMLGAVGVVLLLLLLIGGAGLWGLMRMQAMSAQFSERAFGAAVTLVRLQVALGDLGRFEKDMVIAYATPADVRRAQAGWQTAHESAQRQLEQVFVGTELQDSDLVRAMQQQLAAYAAAVHPVAHQLIASGYETASVANRMLAGAHSQFDALRANIERAQDALTAQADRLRRNEAAISQQTRWLFGLAVALAALLVLPTTLINMRSICRPLEKAQRLAQAIAQGDLTQAVRVDGRDELTSLMRALDGMQAALAHIVGEVRNGTESMGSASTQIASGNQDLSNRTEQTAHRLQQTAASLAQLTSTVRQSSESAHQAVQMAQSNADTAARGGQVVAQVVSTMDEINHSSQKIGDIVGVIDSIAFQTNILALNAAVEAARAGEHGRGFAVVATEVRNLAQRSAQAAKEIKGLIQASMEKVANGSQLVAQAGSTIGEIVTKAKQVSTFIHDITTAANEQSQGIGQVNSAVNLLDQMTQQNAALVEESAAAAASLRDQAGRLAELVRVFRLPGHGSEQPA